MRTTTERNREKKWRIAATLLVLGVLAFGLACDDDDDDTGGAGTYTGTLSGSGVSGSLSLTIAATTAVAVSGLGGGTEVTGALSVGGPPILLSGTFDASTGALSVTGGGYLFTGQVQNGRILGQWDGPGASEGSFVALLGDGSVVTVLCGTFTCTAPPACDETGSFNLAVGLNVALLAATDGSGDTGVATGTFIGSAVHFVSGTLTIDGTVSGSTVTGTWSDSGSSQSGTWQGSSAACGAD